MSKLKILITAGFAALAFIFVGPIGGAVAGSKPDYAAMSPEELAEYLIFDAKGFRLDQKTQEGGTVRDRQTQDEMQKTCSALRDNADSDSAAKLREIAMKSMTQPKGGIKLGNWKQGEQVARSGYGFRVGHKTDNHSKRAPGGNCYACHQLDPKEIAYGTMGPSLKNYGKLRGTGDAMLKYTYEVIYNAHAYFPCTNMPRFGSNGVLNQEQIADVMAYLMDPKSPVNQ